METTDHARDESIAGAPRQHTPEVLGQRSMMCSGRTGSLIRQGAGYEIKGCCNRDCARPRIEAWTPGLGWPAVCAAKHGGEWIVFVDPVIAEVAGFGAVWLTAISAINAEHALDWVELLAALHVKAVAK